MARRRGRRRVGRVFEAHRWPLGGPRRLGPPYGILIITSESIKARNDVAMLDQPARSLQVVSVFRLGVQQPDGSPTAFWPGLVRRDPRPFERLIHPPRPYHRKTPSLAV